MSQLAEAVGSPIPAKIGDKTYLLSPLSVGDMGTLELAAEEAAVKRATASIRRMEDAGITDQPRKQKILDALDEEIDTGRTMGRFLSGFEGAALMVWLSVRHEHPQATLEEVKGKLTWIGMREISRQVESISTPTRGGSPDPNPPSPPDAAGQTRPAADSSSNSPPAASTPGTPSA